MQSYCYLHKPLYSSGIWTGLFSPPDISHSNFCRFTLCPPGTFRTCFASSSWVTWQNGKYTYSGSALVFPLIHWGLIWYTYALIVWIKCKWYHRDVLGPDNAIHGIVMFSTFVKMPGKLWNYGYRIFTKLEKITIQSIALSGTALYRIRLQTVGRAAIPNWSTITAGENQSTWRKVSNWKRSSHVSLGQNIALHLNNLCACIVFFTYRTGGNIILPSQPKERLSNTSCDSIKLCDLTYIELCDVLSKTTLIKWESFVTSWQPTFILPPKRRNPTKTINVL